MRRPLRRWSDSGCCCRKASNRALLTGYFGGTDHKVVLAMNSRVWREIELGRGGTFFVEFSMV